MAATSRQKMKIPHLSHKRTNHDGGKMKYAMSIFLVTLLFLCAIGQGTARENMENREQVREKFRSEYDNAKNKEEFLLESAKGNDAALLESVIGRIKREARRTISPKHIEALKTIEGNKDPRIARQAAIVHQQIEDTSKYNEFKNGLKDTQDKRTFLHSYANTDSDQVAISLAWELGSYDDPESVAILKDLLKYENKTIWGEDDGIQKRSVRYHAQSSLDKIETGPVLKKLAENDTPLSEKEQLVRQYGASTTSAYREGIYSILKKDAAIHPEFAVPLMVEFDANYVANEKKIINTYPHLIDEGLDKCLEGQNSSNVAHCIYLITKLHKFQYQKKVYEVTFGEQGNLNYTSEENNGLARENALDLFLESGVEGLDYLEKVLYTKTTYKIEKHKAWNRIANLKSRDALAVLENFVNSGSPVLDEKINRDYKFNKLEVEKRINELKEAVK